MSEIPDAWVDDFFALAGEGMKPRCSWCGGEKEWNDDYKAWECINPDCEGG